MKGIGEQQPVALRGHHRDTRPTNHFTDTTKKTAYELLLIPHLWIPPPGPWASPTFQVPHPHTLPPCSCQPVWPPMTINISLCRQLVRKCRKMTQLYRTEKKHAYLTIQHCPRESKQEAVGTHPGFAGSRKGK